MYTVLKLIGLVRNGLGSKLSEVAWTSNSDQLKTRPNKLIPIPKLVCSANPDGAAKGGKGKEYRPWKAQ